MTVDLLAAVEASDRGKALEYLRERTEEGYKAWDLHLALFPIVQRVLNPPYINPHLPKMYGICRELIPYLEKEEVSPLVALELNEYTRRSKLEKPCFKRPTRKSVSFEEIEEAIGAGDREKTTGLLSVFHKREGAKELARRLLLLGSGYLDQSLGHSISCTAFILLEMLERVDEDPMPALFALAHYFCKGHFHSTPPLGVVNPPFSEDSLAREMLKATSGRGFVNIHHTITLYAVERVSHLLTSDEHQSLLAACKTFMGEKKIMKVSPGQESVDPGVDYKKFYETFSRLEPMAAVQFLLGLAESERSGLGRFLVKGVCDLYNGAYDPHYLTGLGAALWAVNRFAGNREIAASALYQYLDFLFDGLRSNP